MTRTEALRAAKKDLPADAGDHEVALEAMRQMGIDVTAKHHDTVIEDHCRSSHFYLGPMGYLKYHTTTARERHDGKAAFHF